MANSIGHLRPELSQIICRREVLLSEYLSGLGHLFGRCYPWSAPSASPRNGLNVQILRPTLERLNQKCWKREGGTSDLCFHELSMWCWGTLNFQTHGLRLLPGFPGSWWTAACPSTAEPPLGSQRVEPMASAQSVIAASCSQTHSLSLIQFWACRPPPQSLMPLRIIWQSGYHRGSELARPEWGLTVCLSTTLLGAAAGPETTQRPEELASNCETKEAQEKYKQCERTCPLVSAKMRDLSNEQDKCSSGQDLKGLGQDLSTAEMFFMSAFLLPVLPGTLTLPSLPPPTQPPLPPFLPLPTHTLFTCLLLVWRWLLCWSSHQSSWTEKPDPVPTLGNGSSGKTIRWKLRRPNFAPKRSFSSCKPSCSDWVLISLVFSIQWTTASPSFKFLPLDWKEIRCNVGFFQQLPDCQVSFKIWKLRSFPLRKTGGMHNWYLCSWITLP